MNIKGNSNVPLRKRWLLPYQSAIVCPIRQEEAAHLGMHADRCIGFLAIDSATVGVFRRQWDVPLGKAFAHAMYGPLNMYAELDRLTGSQRGNHEQR
jgi:hypothetical protein